MRKRKTEPFQSVGKERGSYNKKESDWDLERESRLERQKISRVTMRVRVDN